MINIQMTLYIYFGDTYVRAETPVTKPAGFPNGPEVFRDMGEKGTAQAKETYEKMNAATTEAADLIKNRYSTAVKGMQRYNNKIIEFAQVNTNAAFDFVQKMSDVKSPSAFVELWYASRSRLWPSRPSNLRRSPRRRCSRPRSHSRQASQKRSTTPPELMPPGGRPPGRARQRSFTHAAVILINSD